MLLITLGGRPSAAAPEPPRPVAVAHDLFVLVDVTGSMATDQGEGSVWAAVSASLTELIGRLTPGTNVAVVPFDAGPRLSLTYPGSEGGSIRPVAIDADIVEELRTHVATLPVDGQGTHIYESVEFALGELARWRSETPDLTRVQTLVLYTDGEDNGPHGDEGVAGLSKLVTGAQQADASLAVVYHDVAGLLSEGERQVLKAAGVQVVAVEPAPSVAIEAPSVDLGRVDPGASVAFEFRLTSAFSDVFGRRVEASIVGSEGVILTSSGSILAPVMPFELSFPEEPIPGEQVELVLRSVDADFVLAPHDRVAVRFDLSISPPAAIDMPTEAEPVVAPRAAEAPEAQQLRPGVALEATGAALLGLGLVVGMGGLMRRRAKVSGTTVHRLLLRHGAEPNSLLDPGTRLIALSAEDLEPRSPCSQDDCESHLDWDLGVLLRHADLMLRNGKLHVRPLNVPLFVGAELVPAAGRRLRTGELLRIREMHVRYDQCEVK